MTRRRAGRWIPKAAFLLDLAREIARLPGEARRHRPSPPDRGLVVEIGAGQAPHPRANVVVDKYVTDSFERPGEEPLDLSRPLIVADGQRLPFKDKSVDYVLALHVLEHAADPAAFARELQRITSAGFVQVPTRTAELTFGWPYHPWLIDLTDGLFTFEPKGDRCAPAGGFFHDNLSRSALLRAWWAANRSAWVHSVEWRGELSVRAIGESAAHATASLDVEATAATLAQHSGRIPMLPDHVLDLLVCPVDRGAFERSEDHWRCCSCGRSYPYVAGVPILLVEAAMTRP